MGTGEVVEEQTLGGAERAESRGLTAWAAEGPGCDSTKKKVYTTEISRVPVRGRGRNRCNNTGRECDAARYNNRTILSDGIIDTQDGPEG